ncbi:hypothetical protein CHS0354_034978 [Potamilus streckersoni]|uniref:Uncharacterized protein n=1 Tax=Potamilus streckersoni TaxID=2493646 RepID=A0AAE0SDK0_9BIVA|nr:hypothetical protein CHS0354_034978 [Potamilus streckersoni]
MPTCADFKFSILVGGQPIPEYEKDGTYYAESNLFTPFSYRQPVEEIVGGEVERQAWPVTPYQICIEATPQTPHCFYRVFLDGQKVESLSVKPGKIRLVKGFRDGTTVKEFLFSLPRFARDEDDRMDSQCCTRIGLIEVECYNAVYKNTKRIEMTRKMTFDQANKKDSYNVTKGSYLMATTTSGQVIGHKTRFRLTDSWNVISLRSKLCIKYVTAQSLTEMGFTVRPFFPVTLSLGSAARVKSERQSSKDKEEVTQEEDTLNATQNDYCTVSAAKTARLENYPKTHTSQEMIIID